MFKKKNNEIENFEVDATDVETSNSSLNEYEEIDDEQKEETKLIKEKKKNPIIIKNPMHSYKFWFKIFAFVLLIILGFILIFQTENAQMLVLMFTGGVFCVYAVMRFIPLMKTLEKGSSKFFCLIEVFFDLVVGVLLIFLAAKQFGEEQSGIVKFFVEHYNLLIGVVLWLRGFVYFFTTIMFAERTDRTQFWVHIIVITAGSFLLGYKIDAKWVAIGIAIIAFISGLAIGGEGFYEYGKYRKNLKERREKSDKAQKEKTKGKEAPTKEEPKQIDEPKEEVPIIDDGNSDDRPYVS